MIPLIYSNRSIQVLSVDGRFMSDDVQEEPATGESEEEEIVELTIEERQEALKRARWNVFLPWFSGSIIRFRSLFFHVNLDGGRRGNWIY